MSPLPEISEGIAASLLHLRRPLKVFTGIHQYASFNVYFDQHMSFVYIYGLFPITSSTYSNVSKILFSIQILKPSTSQPSYHPSPESPTDSS